MPYETFSLVFSRVGTSPCSITETMVPVCRLGYDLVEDLTYPVDMGKVLAGLQVPTSDHEAFDAFLEKLNYTYVEETDNPIYKQYLCANA